jgi:transposase
VISDIADSGNTVTFFKFLVKVVRLYPNQKIIMVLDNVRYHHAKRLKPILDKYKHRIEIVYLPAYSPDLNPIERIWWYMRKKITHNRYLESMNDRITKFNEFIKTFETENETGKNLSKLIVNI